MVSRYAASRTVCAALCALALCVTLPAAGRALGLQQTGVTFVGQVSNETPGAAVPAGLPVTLHVLSGLQIEEHTAILDSGGAFRFDDVALAEGDIVAARVVYQGAAYFSASIAFDPAQGEISLPIVVYEATEDISSVLVTHLHLFLSLVGDHLQVEEYYLIGNEGDRTFVGVEEAQTGRRVTLPLVLPSEAEGLWFGDAGLGERYLVQEEGFFDTEPVLPGAATVEISLSYELPYQEGMQVERTFAVPVQSVAVVLSENGLLVEGAGVELAGALDTPAGLALTYAAGPLAAGEPLVFALATSPWPASETAASTDLRSVDGGAWETAAGLAALALALVIVYLVWRAPAAGSPPEEVRPLVADLAALDAEFEAGRVDEEAYRRKRKALKMRIQALLESGADHVGD